MVATQNLDSEISTQGNENQNNEKVDPETIEKKLPYPKSVFFIISNEFCERFTYYGMKAILMLYFTQKLMYDDNTATVLYHAFSTMVYFMCVFGAIISDSWLGKFKTILILSVVYAFGNTIIALGAIPTLSLPTILMTLVGLLMIAVGSGGIKPCVAAFGGDQFQLPAQAGQMASFFSVFYFSINAGSLVSTFVTPILRNDVKCFGDNDCFSLAFGVPAILMIISIVVFILGKPLYRSTKPAGNMLLLVAMCIGNAISTKRREGQMRRRTHWLDYAEEKYGKKLVKETKILLKILVLYIPLPLFWALFDQQGSRWTVQATRMSGDIGFYSIKPDQMQTLNPLLILLFIPLYDSVFYPLLAKIGITRPLQKLTAGGILAAVSFFISGLVEIKLEDTYPVLPSQNQAHLRFFNSFPCEYRAISDIPKHEFFVLNPMEMTYKEVNFENGTNLNEYTCSFTSVREDPNCPHLVSRTFSLKGEMSKSVFITDQIDNEKDIYLDDPRKGRSPLIRFLVSPPISKNLSIINTETGTETLVSAADRELIPLPAAQFSVSVGDEKILDLTLSDGSVSTVIVKRNAQAYSVRVLEVTKANTMNILWLVPQYVILTLGEVMFSVTGLEFSYSQAPDSMKSVLQACWLLAVAIGNVIVIIVAGSKIFDSQAYEFFLFAFLMVIDMGLFVILAWMYKPINLTQTDDDDSDEDSNLHRLDDSSGSTVPIEPQMTALSPTEKLATSTSTNTLAKSENFTNL